MSRTKHSSKSPGFDYGSRRPTKSSTGHPGWCAGFGPEVKQQTHRAEQAARKEQS